MFFRKHNSNLKIEQLYYQFRNMMYKEAYFILRDAQLAEDAVSEAIVRIMKNLHKIDETDTVRTRAFFAIVTRNVAKDIYRKRTPLSEDTYATSYESTSPSALDIVIDKESVERIISVIQNLKPIYKDTLILRKFYGLSCDEIANLSGVSVETVQKRLTRAKAQVAEALKKEVCNNEK